MLQPSTPYDEVEYPCALYRTTHPEHLAALARLHGLDAADPRRARVLEIAGSDGFNVLAMAAAFPDAEFVNFDLAPTAIARGKALGEAAGLANARIEVGDVVEAAERYEGRFDYVIAHGLYAWVPPAVQEATFRLIDRVLAPEGIAYVSYNALPGCHLRIALREMVNYELEGVAGHEERLRHARAILSDYAQPRPGDTAQEAGLRRAATLMGGKSAHALFHDEMGEWFDPKALRDVVAEAARHGLAYLGEAQPGGLFHGLPGSEMDDAAVVRHAQLLDFRDICFFHQSLFIRPGRQPRRVLDPGVLRVLLAGVPSALHRTGETSFAIAESAFEIGDRRTADYLDALIHHAPLRLPLAEFADSPPHIEVLLQLVNRGIVELHSLPFPGAAAAGERPLANRLLRTLIARGETRLFSLDHRVIEISDEGPRRFLALLDGTRDHAALAADWEASGLAGQTGWEAALGQLIKAGMISA